MLLPNTNTENIAISNAHSKDLLYSINEQLTNDELKQSTLTIRLNSRNASGLIKCSATNFFSNNVVSNALISRFFHLKRQRFLLKTIAISIRFSIGNF